MYLLRYETCGRSERGDASKLLFLLEVGVGAVVRGRRGAAVLTSGGVQRGDSGMIRDQVSQSVPVHQPGFGLPVQCDLRLLERLPDVVHADRSSTVDIP